jgi:uncharacterized membrane protein YcaP (DUF421 family)
MSGLRMPDWSTIFVPDASLLESFVRGSVVYLSILILFRVVMKRQSGSLGLPDVMLVVLVSECVSTALSSEAKSVANGIVAVGALLFWSFVLDRLGHRWPWFQRLLEPQPVVLVEEGKPNRDNLNREGITDEELLAQVREHGIDDLNRVKTAILESGGTGSVIPRDLRGIAVQGAAFSSSGKADLEGSVKQTVADELRAAIDWHQRCAADHRAAAKRTRALLNRHGKRKAHRKPRPGQDEKG